MSIVSSKKIAGAFARVLSKAESEDERKAVVNAFAEILVRRSSVSKLGEILKSFSKVWNEKHGLVDVDVVAADLKHAPHIKSIGTKKVNLRLHEDKSLIAGSVITVGDYVLDQSLKAKINLLKKLS